MVQALQPRRDWNAKATTPRAWKASRLYQRLLAIAATDKCFRELGLKKENLERDEKKGTRTIGVSISLLIKAGLGH